VEIVATAFELNDFDTDPRALNTAAGADGRLDVSDAGLSWTPSGRWAPGNRKLDVPWAEVNRVRVTSWFLRPLSYVLDIETPHECWTFVFSYVDAGALYEEVSKYVSVSD